MTQTVALINNSDLSASKFKKLYQALSFQLERDYNNSPWVKLGISPAARLVTGEEPTDCWTLTVIPHGNNTGGEGWHEEGEDGSIKGFVNYGVTKAVGGLLSAVASHELLEMMVDPSSVGTFTNPTTGITYKAEVCDPVFGIGYEVFGQLVSDFCQPAWFGIADELPFSWYTQLKSVGAAGQLGPNGYIEVQYPGETGWHSIVAPNQP